MRGLKFSLLLFLNILVLPNNTSTTAQLESQSQTSCNSCCQGPVGSPGTPGIPGVPGTSGIPGSHGPKGDSIKGDKGDSIKGDTGSRGEKGDTGSPGLKGEQGMVGLRGPPGKVGPGGISGPAGPPGVSGVKGQKGEMGQSRVSAFSAVRSSSFTPSSANQALPFDQVHTNVGNDFNSVTGQYTCEIPGIYLFSYHIMSHSDTIFVRLVKNDNAINSVFKTDDDRHDMVSNTAVLQLAIGDQVWLRCPYAAKKIYSDGSLCTSFSGVILYEI